MFGLLARLLELLYSAWPSYGGAIILFTVVIMLVLAPLTFKSTRSMLAMQALQPEMKKLQNRYKDDRQKLNEEMMKFYQENKISPLGGCLPMFIQLPVFFILYQVLYRLTLRGPFGGDMGHAVACHMGGVNTCSNGAFTNAGFFHPSYLNPTSKLYISLSHTRTMDSFGLDLAQSAWNSLKGGLAHAAPFIVMVLVVMGLTYYQQHQIQSRQPKSAEQNPTQQMMMKVMPVAMGLIYVVIPAGVVVYFLVSSLFRIGQQAMVTRTFYTGPNAVVIPTTAVEESAASPIEKRGFFAQFKPSGDSLPRVGKNAPSKTGAARVDSVKDGGAESQKSSPKTTKAKSGSSGKPKSGGTPSRQKNSAPSAKNETADESAAESPRVTPTRQAPSRSAPNQQTPKGKRK